MTEPTADRASTAVATDEAAVTDYESLRDHVLTGTTGDRPCGWVVLIRHGLAAWTTRRRGPASAAPDTAHITRTAAPDTAHTARTAAPPILDDERYAALVPLLVNMVLRTHQEVHL